MDHKQQAKQRNQLKQLQNRVTLSFQTGHLKTWKELSEQYGSTRCDDTPILWPELKSYLQEQRNRLEESFNEQNQLAKSTEEVQANKSQIVSSKGDDTSTDHTNLQVFSLDRNQYSGGEQKAQEATVVKDEEVSASLQAKDITPKDTIIYNKSDYGLFDIPNSHLFLYWFQKKAVRELLHQIVGLDPAQYEDFETYKTAYLDPLIVKKPKSGVLLLSPTGTGKTYIIVIVFRILWSLNYHENRTWSHIPYLLVTKSTVIEQTGRVLSEVELASVADVEVINIEMLRSNRGKMWIKKEEKIIQGDPVIEYNWKPNLNPCVVAFDESQGAKNVATIRNRGSSQGQIMCAYSDIKRNAQLISISATPFTRVCEAKCFAVSTHKDITYILGVRSPFPEGTKLSNDNWPTYAGIIASPASPFDYVQAAIERLMEDLKDYIVRVTGVKPQFKAHNSVKVITFRDDESRKRYQKAWEIMQERKAKADALKGIEGAGRSECMFAIITAFTMAAEKEHSYTWAQEMHHIVTKQGKAAVCNVKFKGTIIETFKELMKLGVTRDDISIIWGGGQTQLTEKQKNKELIKKKRAALEAMGMTPEEIIADMGLDDVEDRVIEDFPHEWRLGTQSKEERQSEIDRFQSGITLYCFYTLKAGGVGLSLHHTDELLPKVYGKKAKQDLSALSIPPEVVPIVEAIHSDNIDQATKLWNKFKGTLEPAIHSCLVRILKCRRKESGFVVEEDVVFNPIRQRKVKGTLSYNAIELVQGVGRVPRLTSQTDTDQEIDVYAGTYETEMGAVVSQKLRCLSSVVKAHEDWQDIIMGGDTGERAKIVAKLLATTEGKEDEEGSLIDEASEEDE